ncbi:MAG: disulfide bond formation protein B [Gammaproteobacteria bacterium]|nr:disulfide bond formation protein B [Gammaproteobacteria bacterium]
MIDRITSESCALLIILATGALLFAAQIMEHQFDMAPCPLCLMQRIWFFFAGFIAYVGLIHKPRWGIYPLLTMLASFVGGGFAIRQLWLQSLPADQVPACGPGLEYLLEVLPLTEVLKAMTSGTGDCAEVAWSFGLTIPGWALVGFIGIAVAAVLQWRAKS